MVIGIAHHDDLLRPVADGHAQGFCKLAADRRGRSIPGAHVVGEYAAETVQTVAAARTAGLTAPGSPRACRPAADRDQSSAARGPRADGPGLVP
jgi:pyruvate/2-oxoglutarate dehydrogenase complex dihydrolipoamide dehydrogenase (E3) component